MSDNWLVGVVGCGVMGSGIAEVCARAGAEVRVVGYREASLETGRRRVIESLDTALRRGKLTPHEHAAALQRMSFATDLTGLRDCRLVIESVVEDEPVKAAVFRDLDGAVKDPEAILASNTSSIAVARLAAVTSRPGRVIGMHFFNPVPVMPLVEVVTLAVTDECVFPCVESFVTDGLGKEVIRSQDRPGFVVNALLLPYLLSAIRLVESGRASPEDIDRGMVLGCAHPMGPLRLADLVGLDTLESMARRLHGELQDPSFLPPPLLVRTVRSGRLGKKSGQGFYPYG